MKQDTIMKICPDCGEKHESSIYGRKKQLCKKCAKKRNNLSWMKSHRRKQNHSRLRRSGYLKDTENFYDNGLYGSFGSSGKIGIQQHD